MQHEIVARLLAAVCAELGEPVPTRDALRVWGMSGVERLALGQGPAIFKYARAPFDGEDAILDHCSRRGLAVPRVLASAHHGQHLGMLLEDLGEPAREPSLSEAAAAAVAVHATPAPEGLPVLDAAGLAALPERALEHLAILHGQGRWPGTGDIAAGLRRLAAVAEQRAADAARPPFGLVHSEFHASSVHLDTGRVRVLDMARALVGPGLLDLASWQGTQVAPDPAVLDRLLRDYVAAGGAEDARADRAGLAATHWAAGWHRLWAVEWYLEQAHRWDPQPDLDEHDAAVVRRHVTEAEACLRT